MARQSRKPSQTLNRILDAALRCYERTGINKTTLDEVAKEAEVGRTTLYRYISNHDDLLNKVLTRDADEQREEMRVALRYHANLADAVVDGILFIVRSRRVRPINKLLFGANGVPVVENVGLSPSNFTHLSKQMLSKQFEEEEKRGNIREGVTLDMMADWVARITLSFVSYPGEPSTDEQQLRQYLQAFLVSSLIKDERKNVSE